MSQSGSGLFCLHSLDEEFSESMPQLIFITLDKSEYRINMFLISARKLVLWVLIRSALSVHF